MEAGWRDQRRTGIAAIAAASGVALALWLTVRYCSAPVAGGEDLSTRMGLALKCICLAAAFSLLPAIGAVAHERLRSPAFDPLAGNDTRRLAVNLRNLQNTLEQFLVLAPALAGLAWYSADGAELRAVTATTAVWIVFRFAFWIGYHRSAGLRGLGIPSMVAGQLALLYVVWRIGLEIGGAAAGVAVIGGYLTIEAMLFATTGPPKAERE